jgi:multiple sugar transport system permease protein
MYINVDLWKKAGLDPDKPVKTLDDWLAAVKKRRRTELGIFWRVVLPSVRPALATLVIVEFMWTWNELFWPLVVVNSPTIRW